MGKNDNEFQEYLGHLPKGISKKIKDYATEGVFRKSRYIFTWRSGKRQYGYCTHCRSNFETYRFSHNLVVQCPQCMSTCIVKASGRGRSKLIDEAYFVYYEKSHKNPQAIIARGFRAVRDYSGDFSRVETQYLAIAYYIFEMGNTVMLTRFGYYSMDGIMKTWGELHKRKSVYSNFNFMLNTNHILGYSRNSIKDAVQDTPFRFSAWESYNEEDMVRFFDLYARYPCIEYLTKLGFSQLVKDKLEGKRTYSAVNWRGKTLFQVLRVSKTELKEIKSRNMYVTFWFLKLLQLSRKDGSNLSPSEVYQIDISEGYLDILKTILKYTSLRKADGYLQKQCKKHPKHFKSQNQVLLTWKDYIADCIKLEMNLTKDVVRFPGNLYRAHQNTIKQVKIKADQELNKKIKDRLKVLNRQYCFEFQGLTIRPAQSTDELIAEGKALNHCVGTYGKRYAAGDIVLLFIRKISEPDKSFYTMEIWGKEVIQVRGMKNCNPDKQVEEFIAVFKAEKLSKKKPESRVRIPA